MRKSMRIGAIAALIFAGVAAFGGSASATETATIDLHFRECPADAVDVFEDCHHHPSTGYDVWVSGAEAEPLDEDGNASFEVVPGSYSWNYDGDDIPAWPDDYITSYCSLQGGDGSDIEPKVGDTVEDWAWSFVVEAGDHVVCDIYFAGGEAEGHDNGTDGGAEMPNTGVGPMTTGASAGFFLAGVVALGGLAVASRKRAFR